MIGVRDPRSGAKRSLPGDTTCVAVPWRASGEGSLFSVRILDERSARVQFVDHRDQPCYSDAKVVSLGGCPVGDVVLVDAGAPVQDVRLARVGYRNWIPVVVLGKASTPDPTSSSGVGNRGPVLA